MFPTLVLSAKIIWLARATNVALPLASLTLDPTPTYATYDLLYQKFQHTHLAAMLFAVLMNI